MKKLLLVTTPLLMAACSPVMPPMAAYPPAMHGAAVHSAPAHANLPAATPRQGQYVALPGQATVHTDAAFDQQVAAYTNPAAAPVVSQQPVEGAAPVAPAPVPNGSGVIVNPSYSAAPAVAPQPESGLMAQTAPMGQPQAVPGMVPQQPMSAEYNHATAPVAPVAAGTAPNLLPGIAPNPTSGVVDYTLRITNATSGRVFVEAQDAAGEIYPCGFMTGSQSISSEKKQVAPIKGPITVVVRDPDKPDAPELRRYQVTPPAGYAGKTLEITIISGGLYQVSVDGQVRYITPTPVGKPDLGNAASTPTAPTAPAAPGAPAGPAPEQTPAGM